MSERYRDITEAARRVLSRPEPVTELAWWHRPAAEDGLDELRDIGIPTRTVADRDMKLARITGGE